MVGITGLFLKNGTLFRIIETMLAVPESLSTSVGIRIYANGDPSTRPNSSNLLGKARGYRTDRSVDPARDAGAGS